MRSQLTAALALAALVITEAWGAISFGPAGTGVLSFDTLPAVSEWSTAYINGASLTFYDDLDLEAAVQTNMAAMISRPLQVDNSPVPSASLPAEWSNFGFVQTRPAGVAANLIMATVQNNSGTYLERVYIVYNLTVAFPTVEGPIYGQMVYLSLTGDAGSWIRIPALSAERSGVLEAVVDLSHSPWPHDAVLFLLWADDNSPASPDTAYQIDNFAMGMPDRPPHFARHPTNTSILQCRSGSLFIAMEDGAPATLAWYKDGMPIDSYLNPSAATTTLVLSNVQSSDASTYFVRATNVFGWAQSSNATVTIDLDTHPPAIIRAVWDGVDPNRLVLTFSEAMNYDALVESVWAIESTTGGTPLSIISSGTFTTLTHDQIAFSVEARDPSDCYTITSMEDPSDECAGNVMPAGARACIDSSLEMPCPANRKISLSRNANGTVTIKRACGTLQQTSALPGGWIDSPDQANPLTIRASAAAQFYRGRD